jgi:endo-1,4-beta-xylanase
VHGHTLIWHRQLPTWIRLSEPADRETHMREFIERVLTRYGNDIPIWDVVNEALEEDGTFRQSIWFDSMGARNRYGIQTGAYFGAQRHAHL